MKRNALKLTVFLLAALCLFSAIGCALLKSEDDKIMDRFWELMDKMAEANRSGDYEAFKALFYQPDDNVVSMLFQSPWYRIREFDKRKGVIVDRSDEFCYIGFTYYTASGQYPNTHTSNFEGYLAMVDQNGEWKVLGNEQMMNTLLEPTRQAVLKSYDGSGALSAAAREKINESFFTCIGIATSDEMYYEEEVGGSVAYLVQKENGDVLVAVWFKNGTKENRSMYNIRITVTDQKLGTVLDEEIDDTVTVKAEHSVVRVYTIPASRVKTGTQTWGIMNGSVNTNSK